jgi:hypothetical protein
MLSLSAEVIAFLAAIGNVLVQAIKGLLPEAARPYIPVGLLVVMSLVGIAVAMYAGRDPVVGLFEGFLGAATAVGLYEGAAALPGLNRVYNEDGWIRRAGDSG